MNRQKPRSVKIALATAATVALLPALHAPAAACEKHLNIERDNDAREATPAGPITFQPAPPESPTEGEIWIDATNGRQYVFHQGVWIERWRDVQQTSQKTI